MLQTPLVNRGPKTKQIGLGISRPVCSGILWASSFIHVVDITRDSRRPICVISCLNSVQECIYPIMLGCLLHTHEHQIKKDMVRIMTTILVCVVTLLMVMVIVIERRMRQTSHHCVYSAQAIIPCSCMILPSKWYTLFRIPADVPKGVRGHIVLSGTGSSTQDTNVSVTIHGTSSDGIALLTVEDVKTFELDTILDFEIDPYVTGSVIAIRVETSNPGSHMLMSDIIATLVIR